jgi:hypothetical protein
MGQPRSGCTRRSFGAAARQVPGGGDPRNFGGCRAGAWRVCHRITPAIAGPQRAVPGPAPGRPGWLATQASSPYAGLQSGTYCQTCTVCQVPEDKMTESARLPRPPAHHTKRSAGRLERRPAPGHPDTCRVCPHPPRTVDLPPVFPGDLRCPGFPGVGVLDPGHATGRIWLARGSYSIGVSLPGCSLQPHSLAERGSSSCRAVSQ